jgi:hypothetical protein
MDRPNVDSRCGRTKLTVLSVTVVLVQEAAAPYQNASSYQINQLIYVGGGSLPA